MTDAYQRARGINPVKALEISRRRMIDDNFDEDRFDKRWDRGEEDAVIKACEKYLDRKCARAIITALDRFRLLARKLE